MKKKGLIEGEKTAFEQLVDMFHSHSYMIKTIYDVKKMKLSTEIRHTISDEAKTVIIVNELQPLNDRLRNKNTISILIEQLDDYMDMAEYILNLFVPFITMIDLANSNIDNATKEFELVLDSYDLSKVEHYKPTKDFDIFVDKFSNTLREQLGNKKEIATKYLTCDIDELMLAFKTDRDSTQTMFATAYLNFLKDVDKDARTRSEFNAIFMLFAIEYAREYAREYANTPAAARWIGGIFYHYYETEYVKFLNEELEKYGKKLKHNLVLDEVLKVSKSKSSPLYWTKTKGAKIDLIRILVALYDNKYFELENGQIPSKELVMKEMGDLLHIDLSDYDSNLHHGMSSSLEHNLAVFEKLKNAIQKRKLADEGVSLK